MSRKIVFVDAKASKSTKEKIQQTGGTIEPKDKVTFKNTDEHKYHENPKELKKMIKDESKDITKDMKAEEQKIEKEKKEKEKKISVKNSELISAVSQQILKDILNKKQKNEVEKNENKDENMEGYGIAIE